MGNSYTRNDTSNNIADANIIEASDLDGEFDKIELAFNGTTGHSHDGTTGEGGPITKVGPAQEVLVTATTVEPVTTNTVDLGTATKQWKNLYVDGVGYIDSVDIDGGTIDSTVVGGTTPAAGSFTTLSTSGLTTVANFASPVTISGSGDKGISIESTNSSDAFIDFIRSSANSYRVWNDSGVFKISHGNLSSELITDNLRFAISNSGNIGINTATPLYTLTVEGSIWGNSLEVTGNNATAGNVVVGGEVQVSGNGDKLISVSSSNAQTTNIDLLRSGANSYRVTNDLGSFKIKHGSLPADVEDNTRLTITPAGSIGIGTTSPSATLDINGSLAKSSGSFKIDHPLKPTTHHLVHSFIEGPQADNIYRGVVTLVSGVANVNLDTAAGMSEGTFVLLNGNVQCFTSNEDGWCPVRGSVSGNVLTIEAQDNTCTDTISWMVVGERIDQHMIDTEWTDSNGRVIVEPVKGE